MNEKTTILVHKQPTGRLRAKNVWHVTRNHKEDVDLGFLGRILGRGTRHEHLKTFDTREEAIEYAIEESAQEESVDAQLEKSNAQKRVKIGVQSNDC